jgi:argonaute-like protein implicated in RNA metabolism and viral defense
MWARIIDNKIVQTIKHPKSIVINDVQYSKAIFSSAWSDNQRKEIGILPYEYSGSLIDNMFYYTVESTPDIQENKVVITRTKIARNISDIKNTMKIHVNNVLKNYLEQTDWIIIREQDNGTAQPSDFAKWRDDLRVKAKALETAIDSKGDVAGLEAITISTEDGKIAEFNDWPRNPRELE